MRFRWLAVALIPCGLGLGYGCASLQTKVTHTTAEPPPVVGREVEVLARHEYGHAPAAFVVVRSTGRWPGRALSVDLDREMVLVAAVGGRSSTGFGVSITRVVETDDELYVDVVESTPGPGCAVGDALTMPGVAVVVRRVDKPAHFHVRRVAAAPCPSL